MNYFKGYFLRLKKVKFCFDIFRVFFKWFDNFYLVFVHSFLGMVLIDCQEMDFIELFNRSFSRLEIRFSPVSHNY